MDRILKVYMDGCRAAGILPPEISYVGAEGISLFSDQEKLNLWRNWRTGLMYEGSEFTMSGAFDDLLVTNLGLHVPFDYKTKGKEANEEDTIKYYQTQVDCYALMLRSNGMPVADFALFSYWSPDSVHGGEAGLVRFLAQTIKIPVDPDKAVEICLKAAECLAGPVPAHSAECEYCIFAGSRKLVN